MTSTVSPSEATSSTTLPCACPCSYSNTCPAHAHLIPAFVPFKGEWAIAADEIDAESQPPASVCLLAGDPFGNSEGDDDLATPPDYFGFFEHVSFVRNLPRTAADAARDLGLQVRNALRAVTTCSS